MRKILLFLSLLVLLFANVCAAALQDTKKSLVLIYKVDDVALQCQNAENDIIAGQQELEKELAEHYKKRFNIEGIIRGPKPDEKEQPDFYRSLAGDGKAALVITISLHGQGSSYTQYQNAYGAKATGVAPAVNVSLLEVMLDPTDRQIYYWDYGIKSYSSGTLALGRSIIAVQDDPRKNTKNSIRAIFRDACKLDESINRYANHIAYEIEQDRYSGNFKEANEKRQRLYAPANAKIDKFIAWCKEDSSRAGYLAPINQMPSIDIKINYINTFIQMGLYKE